MDVNSVINNLTEKFGTTAPYLIGEMQKYYIIHESMVIFISLVIVTISGIILWKVIKKIIDMQKKDEWCDWESELIYALVPFIFCTAFGIVFFVSVESLIEWYVTPTATALVEIMKLMAQ